MIPSRLAAFLAAFVLALTGLAAAAPAHAGWPGGIVQHAADDSGAASGIIVLCSNGTAQSLARGQRASCGDVDAIWDGAGYQIVVHHTDGRWQILNSNGWNPIGNWTNVAAYYQRT